MWSAFALLLQVAVCSTSLPSIREVLGSHFLEDPHHQVNPEAHRPLSRDRLPPISTLLKDPNFLQGLVTGDLADDRGQEEDIGEIDLNEEILDPGMEGPSEIVANSVTPHDPQVVVDPEAVVDTVMLGGEDAGCGAIRFTGSASNPSGRPNEFCVEVTPAQYTSIIGNLRCSRNAAFPLQNILEMTRGPKYTHTVCIVPTDSHLVFSPNERIALPKSSTISKSKLCDLLQDANALIERLNCAIPKEGFGPNAVPMFQIPLVDLDLARHHLILNAGYLVAFFRKIVQTKQCDKGDVPQWSKSSNGKGHPQRRGIALRIAALLTNYQDTFGLGKKPCRRILAHLGKCLKRQMRELASILDTPAAEDDVGDKGDEIQDVIEESDSDDDNVMEKEPGSKHDVANGAMQEKEESLMSIKLDERGIGLHLSDWMLEHGPFEPLQGIAKFGYSDGVDGGVLTFRLHDVLAFKANPRFRLPKKALALVRDQLVTPLDLANGVIRAKMEEAGISGHVLPPTDARSFDCILNAAYLVYFFQNIAPKPGQPWGNVGRFPKWSSATTPTRKFDAHRLFVALRFAAMMTGYTDDIANYKAIYGHLCVKLGDLAQTYSKAPLCGGSI